MNMFILQFFSVCLLVNIATCKKTSPALKLLEKEKKNVKCKTTDLNTIMHLRAQQSDKKLIACLVKSLESSSGDGVLWSLLGEVFERKGHTSKANVCYKESIKHMGKISKFIKNWHFIGPFTIGKNEVDGDPIQDWNGIKNVSKYRWKKNMDIHYSELIKGGEIKWTRITVSSPDESINVSPGADWNELILSLQSIGIAEWQGWIIGDFVVNEDCAVIVQCLGVSTLYVGETMITGDLYKRQEFWHPVHLKRGVHSVMIKLRSKTAISVHFHLKQVQEKVPLNVLSPPFLPDLVDGKLFSNFISLPVQNLHPSNWLKVVKVSIIKQHSVFKVSFLGKNEKFSIAPGQVKHIILRVDYNDGSINDNKLCQDVELNFKLFFSGGRNEKVDLTLRCRKMSESFLFTFLDHDGSVQHGAAIAPLKGCTSGVCPVLVTLHGTTVSPQSQADSYKRMEGGKWVFGLDNLWVLAPTRHGAHNWEGPGELTSMKALESLSLCTRESLYFQSKADDKKIVIAGHSMGGHGAWILGTHYPDQTLALISTAGWIRKDDYGDSNLFFRHDVSTSHVNSVVKAMMEACITENDVDKHVSNLHGLSVMIRTGGADRTVHPYYSRRMYRLLRQQRSNVSYDEIAGKEHWWWDTYRTNDGGVTNDPVIRGFTIKHAENAGKSSSSNGFCEKEKKNCDNSAKKYHQQQEGPLNRNHVGLFTLTVYNPASVHGVRGVRVVQQLIPFRQSSVQIRLSSGTAALRTDNVARVSLSEPVVSPVHWDQRHITIDDFDINLKESEESPGKSSIHLCRTLGTGSYTWEVCSPEALESKLQRGPLNMGPARRIAESPFLIVTGTTADQDTVAVLRQFAVYIANQFLLTSDSLAHVITDKELDEATADGFNLIVIGRPEQNSWSGRFHEHIPLKFQKSGLSLNGCHFDASRTGALSLAPHAGSRLALMLTGNSVVGIKDVIDLATPTILPMARSPFSNMVPDFVVTGHDFGARGPGGYLCTGFWGNNWEYKRELSSCSC